MPRNRLNSTYRHGDNLLAYTDEEIAIIRDVDERTAEEMIRRVRPVPGTTPAQIVRQLEQEFDARVREEMPS